MLFTTCTSISIAPVITQVAVRWVGEAFSVGTEASPKRIINSAIMIEQEVRLVAVEHSNSTLVAETNSQVKALFLRSLVVTSIWQER